jgi:hypothetical protein
MAQNNLSNKKFIIPLSKLPYPNADGTHRVRFRVTTQDRNELSEWSPIYIVDSPAQQSSASVSYQSQISDNVVTVSWTPNSSYKEYDVFTSIDSGPYQFFTRTSNNSIVVSNTGSQIRVWVQLPTYPFPPSTSNTFKILETLQLP